MQSLEVSWAVRDIYIYIYDISRLRVKVENSSTRSQKINQQWLNLWDLLAGGDLITLGSLQIRLPDSQHNLYSDCW